MLTVCLREALFFTISKTYDILQSTVQSIGAITLWEWRKEDRPKMPPFSRSIRVISELQVPSLRTKPTTFVRITRKADTLIIMNDSEYATYSLIQDSNANFTFDRESKVLAIS